MTIETPDRTEDPAATPDPSRIIGYEFVDPHTLVIEENVRADTGDISDLDPDFVASIADQGVAQPIVVRRRASDNRLVVRTGKGRTRAARHVGRWVDVVIERKPATESDDVREEQIERIVAQLAENQHRVGITDADEVRAHGQLLLLWEMSPTEIAAATHSDPERVRRTTKVATSAIAMDMVGQLDLGHLEVIAELDGDDTAVAELVNVALHNPAQFAHVAQRLRQARELADACAAKAQELTDAGVRVVDTSDHEAAIELHKLRARIEDQPYSPSITDDEHAGCPGHAVSVQGYRRGFGSTVEVDVLAWCLDPATHGHVPVWAPSPAPAPGRPGDPPADGSSSALPADGHRTGADGADIGHRTGRDGDGDRRTYDGADRDDRPDGGAHPGDPDAERRAAERQAAAEKAERDRRYQDDLQRYLTEVARNRREASQAAATVRRDWLAGFLRRKTPPKDAVRYILEALVLWEIDFDDAAAEGHDCACELLGMQAPQLDDETGLLSKDLLTAARSATAGRATVLTLALVLAGQERTIHDYSWRTHTAGVGSYLRALEQWGYTLSPIETLMIDPENTQVTIVGDPVAPVHPDADQGVDPDNDAGDDSDGDSDGDEDPDIGPDDGM